MRHRLKGRRLGRNGPHRRALFLNLFRCSIQQSQSEGMRIRTTLAKAKLMRGDLEKLVTDGIRARKAWESADALSSRFKSGSEEYLSWRATSSGQLWLNAQGKYLHYYRRLFSVLRSRDLVELLVNVIAVKYIRRSGGYTRVVKLAKRRLADGARMAYIEFVDETATLVVQ